MVVVVSARSNDNEKVTWKYIFISFMLPHDYIFQLVQLLQKRRTTQK